MVPIEVIDNEEDESSDYKFDSSEDKACNNIDEDDIDDDY